MIEHNIGNMSELTPVVIRDYLEDLGKDKGTGDIDDAGLDPTALRTYVQPLDYIWWAREALANVGVARLDERPLGSEPVARICEKITKKVGGSIPALDDRDFIHIVNMAWRYVSEHGDALIEANNAIASFREEEIARTGHARRNTREKFHHAGDAAFKATGVANAKVLRKKVKLLRTACIILIQATTGMRVSELVDLRSRSRHDHNGLPATVEIQRTIDDQYELFFVCGRVFKTTPSSAEAKWVCGLRPVGSDYLPPPIHAIQVLERLDEGWRRMAGIENLYIGFLLTKEGFPRALKNIVSLGTRTANQHQQEWVKEIGGIKGDRFTTHMWRKTFAQYMVRTMPGLLPAIAQHFKHVTMAMTEQGYLKGKTGDLELNDLIQAERYRQAAILMHEAVTGHKPIAGPKAAWIRSEVEKLKHRLGNRPSSEIRQDLEQIVKDNDFKLWDSDFGYCVFAAEGPKCHSLTGSLGAWTRRAPNLAERSPPRCIECPHFAVAGDHEDFWHQRLVLNRSKWEQVQDDGRTPPAIAARFRERARQAEIVLTWLEAEKRHAS
jgi:integrase